MQLLAWLYWWYIMCTMETDNQHYMESGRIFRYAHSIHKRVWDSQTNQFSYLYNGLCAVCWWWNSDSEYADRNHHFKIWIFELSQLCNSNAEAENAVKLCTSNRKPATLRDVVVWGPGEGREIERDKFLHAICIKTKPNRGYISHNTTETTNSTEMRYPLDLGAGDFIRAQIK